MQPVIQDLIKLLQNQFLSGGLLLMMTGSVIALLRKVPENLYHWAKRRITVEVEIANSDPLFNYVTAWLHEQPYSKRSRKITATTASDDSVPQDYSRRFEVKKIKVLYSPAPGLHVFLYGGRIIWLEREREGAPTGGGSGNMLDALKKRETYKFTILGRDQSGIRGLIDEIVALATKPSDQIRIFRSHFGSWECQGSMRPRKLNTVILPDGIKESVIASVREFLASREWYTSMGIPWHLGCLLSGIPGTGKSSLVAALAGELGMDLYLLNVAGSGMDDDRLEGLMSEVRSGTIVLMEDVDCTFPGRDDKDHKAVTLSGLLNCLDGIQSREGCLLFMTTNRRGSLDSALIRPGRVDVEVKFDIATDSQIIQLRDRIVPRYSGNLTDLRGKTMAEVQQYFIERRK